MQAIDIVRPKPAGTFEKQQQPVEGQYLRAPHRHDRIMLPPKKLWKVELPHLALAESMIGWGPVRPEDKVLGARFSSCGAMGPPSPGHCTPVDGYVGRVFRDDGLN
jgi:hypothetical protein